MRQGSRDQIGQAHDQRQLSGLGAVVLQENSQERECGPLGAFGTKVKIHSMAQRQRRPGGKILPKNPFSDHPEKRASVLTNDDPPHITFGYTW